MYRKSTILIIIMALLSTTYILATAQYSEMPKKIEWLSERLTKVPAIHYTETGVRLKGTSYDEQLSQDELISRQNDMLQALSHEDECSRLCLTAHANIANVDFTQGQTSQLATINNKMDGSKYTFSLKNQKDIHYNSYYELDLLSDQHITHLDNWYSHAKDLMNKWDVTLKESIYFKGYVEGLLDDNQKEELVQEIYNSLKACQTNYYEDDREETTCAYYAYTPYITDYYIESSGYKTNTQISFDYDELEETTQITIAFPFYNQVF